MQAYTLRILQTFPKGKCLRIVYHSKPPGEYVLYLPDGSTKTFNTNRGIRSIRRYLNALKGKPFRLYSLVIVEE